LASRSKKALRAAEQDRPVVAAKRKLWRAAQPFTDPESLVFLDETGVNTKMAQLYGWAPVGERCLHSVPFGNWKTMTFIAGLRLSGMTAPWVLDGAMDGDAFRIYVRDVLGPTLKPGDVVVLDNLPAHKVAGIREAIADRRAQHFYLPHYSPDINPIEMAFAKLRALLRQEPARTVETLIARIGPSSIASSPWNAPTSSRLPAINAQDENALARRHEGLFRDPPHRHRAIAQRTDSSRATVRIAPATRRKVAIDRPALRDGAKSMAPTMRAGLRDRSRKPARHFHHLNDKVAPNSRGFMTLTVEYPGTNGPPTTVPVCTWPSDVLVIRC